MKKILIFVLCLTLYVVSFGQLAPISQSIIKSNTPTVSTSVYAAGNVVGGKQTFTILSAVDGSASLTSLMIVDKANKKAGLEVLIFSQNPSAGTYTDHVAFAWNMSDLPYLMRKVTVATADYITVDSVAIADISIPGKAIKGTDGSNKLYMVMVTVDTPHYAAATDVTVKLGIKKE